MLVKRILCVLIASGAIFWMGMGYAADTENTSTTPSAEPASSSPSGFYLQPMLGYGQFVGGGYTSGDRHPDGLDHGPTYMINAGYQFNNPFAIEIGVGDLSVRDNDDDHYDHRATVDIAAKYTMPITEKIDLFGKVGAAEVWNPFMASTGILYGIGSDYNINEHVAITALASGITPLGNTETYYHLNSPYQMGTALMLSTGIKFTI